MKIHASFYNSKQTHMIRSKMSTNAPHAAVVTDQKSEEARKRVDEGIFWGEVSYEDAPHLKIKIAEM